MKQAAEYRQLAAECRKLSLSSKSEEERRQLLHIAQTWEQMAENRESVIARENAKDSN